MTKKSLAALPILCRCVGGFSDLLLRRRTQHTDILDRNRLSHGSIYSMKGLHSRSGTASRPRLFVWSDTLLSTSRGRAPWPPARSARRSSVNSISMNGYSHSDGSGDHRAPPGEPVGRRESVPRVPMDQSSALWTTDILGLTIILECVLQKQPLTPH